MALRRSGLGYGMEDLIAPQSEEEHQSDRKEAERLLGIIWDAAEGLLLLHEKSDISPVVGIIVAALPDGAVQDQIKKAEEIAEGLRAIRSMPFSPYADANRASKRGNSASRDLELNAMVRATMHHLHENGQPYRGGWGRSPSRTNVPASRTSDSEWKLRGAAAAIVTALRNNGVDADIAAIKGCYNDYIKELSRPADGSSAPRHPEESDYSWLASFEAGSR